MDALAALLGYRLAELTVLMELSNGMSLEKARQDFKAMLARLSEQMGGAERFDLPQDQDVLAFISGVAGDGRSLIERLAERDTKRAKAWVAQLAGLGEEGNKPSN